MNMCKGKKVAPNSNRKCQRCLSKKVTKLITVTNFSYIGQMIAELEFRPGKIMKTSQWRHTYTKMMASAKFLWRLQDFAPKYHHADFVGNWITNKGETEHILYFTKIWIWLTLFHMGGGADSALFQIAFFITSVRDSAKPLNLVTFPKI